MKLRVEGSAQRSCGEDVLILTIEASPGTRTGGRDNPLRLEVDLPRNILPRSFRSAAMKAADAPPLEIVDGGERVRVTGGSGTWTTWILSPGANEKIITIMLANDLEAESRDKLGPSQRGAIDPEHPSLELRVQLELDSAYDVELSYRAGDRYFEGDDIWVEYRSDEDLSLYLTPGEEDPPEEAPVVSLRSSVEAPTALPLGETVYLLWKVERCKGATLAGPFAEGQEVQVLPLGPQARAAEGRTAITVLSRMTLSLKATVEGPEFDIEVIRHLFLDTLDTHKRCALRIDPATILPNGACRVYWYLSNVYDAQLRVSNRTSDPLVASGGLQSDRGYIDVQTSWDPSARSKKLDFKIEYNLSRHGATPGSLDAKVSILPWLPIEGAFPEAARPAADNSNDNCLVHSPRGRDHDLVYCSPRGVWYGSARPQRPNAVEFEALDFGPCRAVCPASEGFILLLTPSSGPCQLGWFRRGSPLETWSCPPGAEELAAHGPGSYARLIRIGTRVYLYLSRAALGDCFATGAWSCDLEERKWSPEPYLRALFGYELAYCANHVLAFRRATGELVRLDPAADGPGSLSAPRLCARAPHPLEGGVALSVGELLVFLGSEHREDEVPADPVYDLKTNSWRHCGRERGGVRAAAYSGGVNKRLWAIHDDGPVTLAVGSTPMVFWRDYANRPDEVPELDDELFVHDAELVVGNGSEHPFLAWDGHDPPAAIVADSPMIIDEAGYGPLAPGQSCKLRIQHGPGTPTLGLSWRPQLLARWGFRASAKLRPGQAGELACMPEGSPAPVISPGARWHAAQAGPASFAGPHSLCQLSVFNPLRAPAKVALTQHGGREPLHSEVGSIAPRECASYLLFDPGDGSVQELSFELPGMEFYWSGRSHPEEPWVGAPMYDGGQHWESRAQPLRAHYESGKAPLTRRYAEPPTRSKLWFRPAPPPLRKQLGSGSRPQIAEGRFYDFRALEAGESQARILGAEIEENALVWPSPIPGADHWASTLAPRPFVVSDSTKLSTKQQQTGGIFPTGPSGHWINLELEFHVEGFTDRIPEPYEAVFLTHGQIYREAKVILDVEWSGTLERTTLDHNRSYYMPGDIDELLEPTLVEGESRPTKDRFGRPLPHDAAKPPKDRLLRRRYEITRYDEKTLPDHRSGFLGLEPRYLYGGGGGPRGRPVSMSYLLGPEPARAHLRITVTPQLSFDTRDLAMNYRRIAYERNPFEPPSEYTTRVTWKRDPATGRPHEPEWVHDQSGSYTREWVFSVDRQGELSVEEVDASS